MKKDKFKYFIDKQSSGSMVSKRVGVGLIILLVVVVVYGIFVVLTEKDIDLGVSLDTECHVQQLDDWNSCQKKFKNNDDKLNCCNIQADIAWCDCAAEAPNPPTEEHCQLIRDRWDDKDCDNNNPNTL